MSDKLHEIETKHRKEIVRHTIIAVVAAVIFALTGLAVGAHAAEVGECAPQKPGPYADTACRVASATGNHVWRELSGVAARYTDGHPEVLYDEKQVFTAGDGTKLECKGQVVEGEATSFTTNVQIARDNKCELLPSKVKCGNTFANEIPNNIYTSEAGTFVDGPGGTVRNRLSFNNTAFTCGGVEASLSGEYEGQVGYRFAEPTRSVLNKPIHKYDLLVAPGFGEQHITLTVGLQSWPVTLVGEQEDKYGTGHLVVSAGSR